MKKNIYIVLLLANINICQAQLANIINDCNINPNDCNASALIDTWYRDGCAQINIQGSVQLDYIVDVNNHQIFPDNTDVSQKITSLISIYAQYGGKKMLYFPAGTYRLNSTVSIPSDFIIKGDGGSLATSVGGQTIFSFFGAGACFSVGTPTQAMARVGFEDFAIIRNNPNTDVNAYNMLFAHAYNCWMRGIESSHCVKGHVLLATCNMVTVSGCYFHDSHNYGSGGYGYGIDITGSTKFCLIEDNIFNHLRHAIVLQMNAQQNVIGYNYSNETWMTNVDGTLEEILGLANMSADISFHGRYFSSETYQGPSYNLVEGNYVGEIKFDMSHKSNGPYNTIFRNRVDKFNITSSYYNTSSPDPWYQDYYVADPDQYKQNVVGLCGPILSGLGGMIDNGFPPSDYGSNCTNLSSSQYSYYKTAQPIFMFGYEWPYYNGNIPAKYRFDSPITTKPVFAGWNLYSNACGPATLNLTGAQHLRSTVDYEAINQINAGPCIVLSGSTVTMKAGDAVHLQTGFRAEAGSHFHAYIAGCLNAFRVFDTTVTHADVPYYTSMKTIKGYFREPLSRGGKPVHNDTIVLVDSIGKMVSSILYAVTNQEGYFTFSTLDINEIDANKHYGIVSKNGFPTDQSGVLQLLGQWFNNDSLILRKQYLSVELSLKSYFCLNDSVHLAANVTGGIKPYSYSWSIGDVSSVAENPVVKFDAAKNYKITVKVTDASGNAEEAGAKTEVYLPAIPKFDVRNNCLGDTTIVDLYYAVDTTINYLWQFGDGDSSRLAEPTHIYNSAGNYRFGLMVADSLGCTATVVNDFSISACSVAAIFGTLKENKYCGGNPFANDTIVLIYADNSIVPHVSPAITDQLGRFQFVASEINVLDTTKMYGFKTIHGFKLDAISYNNMRYWKTNSPLVFNLSNTNEEWTARYPHVDTLNAVSTAIDVNDNIYVVGTVTNPYTFNKDLLVLKYDSAGGLLWSAAFDGPAQQNDDAQFLRIDNSGSVIVVGHSYNAPNDFDIIVIKYDPAGNQMWATRIDNSVFDNPVSISVDIHNNIFLTENVPSLNGLNTDILVIKINADGAIAWTSRYDSGNADQAYSLTVDDNSNVFVVGTSYNALSFNDYITLKYDSNGVLQWVKTFDLPTNSLQDIAKGIKTDNTGNSYVTGSSATIKYDANGNVVWWVAVTNMLKVLINQEGDICVAGFGGFSKYNATDGTLLFLNGNHISDMIIDNNNNFYMMASATGRDGSYTLQKYDKDGVLKTLFPAFALNDKFGSIRDFAISLNNNVYATGYGNYSTSQGTRSDAITKKYSQCPSQASNVRLSHGNSSSELINQTAMKGESRGEKAESEFTNELKSEIANRTSEIKLYPNPNNGNMFVECTMPECTDGTFAIYDLTGRKLSDYKLTGTRSYFEIKNSQLNNGIYYYEVIGNNKILARDKVVVIK